MLSSLSEPIDTLVAGPGATIEPAGTTPRVKSSGDNRRKDEQDALRTRFIAERYATSTLTEEVKHLAESKFLDGFRTTGSRTGWNLRWSTARQAVGDHIGDLLKVASGGHERG